jgi:putative spermidine/putrescine transport system ATP-binding protein
MLDIINVEKAYGSSLAVANANLSVDEGELVCLLGPSGCGKSTLLRVISGLADATGGRIRIDGRDISRDAANKRPTAMVFQSHALWNHMTVFANVAFGLRVRGLAKAEIAAKVMAALELVGLTGYEKRRPNELSGGQAQRVALARCLVVEPKVLLMDEPFSALDAHLRSKLREELKLLQRRLKLTTIFVTHDQEEAMELADRIVVMHAGRIEQVGAPGELYLAPRSLTVARFIGTMNEYSTEVADGKASWHGVQMPVGVSDGPVMLLCRPEDLVADPAGARFKVERVIDLGSTLKVSAISDQGEPLVWLCSRTFEPHVGEMLSLKPSRTRIFRYGVQVSEAAGSSVQRHIVREREFS